MSRVEAQNRSAIRLAWSRFCDTGDVGYLRGLPPDVAASWQRSRAHGVDPGMRAFPMSAEGTQWDANERFLLRYVEEAVAPFVLDLRDSHALLAVISARGRIVFREGSVATLCAADTIGSVPGALTLESAGGTNSGGTTLYRHEATRIHGLAHYCEAFWAWSDVGAPIVHPRTGDVLGLVDIGLPNGTISPALTVAAKAIATNLQREILLSESVLNRRLLERWPQSGSGAQAALLAIGRDGSIICASDSVRRLLSPDGATQLQDLRALPAFKSLIDALDQRTSATCAIELPGMKERALAAIEPAIEHDELIGAIVRLELPHSRTTAPGPAWAARYSFDALLGDSPAFKPVIALARRLAATDLPVLIHGETGTGKELMAHAIHAASSRAAGPFVTVNCGAIPHELIASELFGYEKGAFTGANRTGQRGKFEQADGGTIFLDEITETSAALQVSLLRVIQDQEVVPVGADRGRRVDVRIISATNREPEQVIAAGILRRDLYYRLNGAVLPLPPLRARREDIEPLARHFCAESGRTIELAPTTLALLLAHNWPGNLRELNAVVRSAALLAEGERVEPHDLPLALRRLDGAAEVRPAAVGDLEAAELDAIERALAATGGNVKEAAARLGIGRSSLYRKLSRLKLTRASSWN